MTAAVKDQALLLIRAAERAERKDQKEKLAVGPADPRQHCVVVDVDLSCELDHAPKAQKGPQKKGSFDGEWKAVAATIAGGGCRGECFNKEAAAPCGGAGLAPEKAVIAVHSVGAALSGTPQPRTPSFRRRRAPPRWSDPRRVLLFFATLSSMGTIILLYFTLAMGRTDYKEGSNAW